MPIEFAQPSPLGSASSIGVGAGEAAAIQKMSPTLAAMYEKIADLRQRGAMSGGGGGSSSANPGGGGVGGDSGGANALYQVESQANRDQRAADESFQAQQPDLVGQHIQQTEQFKVQQQQQADRQQASQLAGLNKQAAPPPQWGQADQEAMANANQAVQTVQSQYEAGQIDEDAASQIAGPAYSRLNELSAKKQSFDEYQQQRQTQQASVQAAQSAALGAVHTDAQVKNGARVPNVGITTPDNWVPNGKGGLVNTNEKQQEYERKVSVEAFKASQEKKISPEAAQKMKQDAELHEQKFQQGADDHYLKIRQHEIDRLNKEEDSFMKDSDGSRVRATPEGFDNTVSERMKAHGLPGTLGDFQEDWQRKRGRSSSRPNGDRTDMQPSQAGDTAPQAKAAPVAKPGPALIQHQVGNLDKVRSIVDDAVKEGRMDTEHTDKAVSAISGLQDLISKGGGDINKLPPDLKSRADDYLETLAKLPIKNRTMNDVAKKQLNGTVFMGGR